MNVSVSDVMSDRVVAVRRDTRYPEIVAAIRRFHVSSLPVVDEAHRVIGLVSEDDLFDREAGRGHGLFGRFRGRADRAARMGVTAAELMAAPPVTVTAATSAREAARMMYRHGLRRLPVIDPMTGRLTGIVTRSDLLAVYERADDDIRHEILFDIIRDTLGLDPERFTVRVANGAVTIRGTVERWSAATRLADAIRHVGGVICVDDRLSVDDRARHEPRAPL
jgi:CBS domain-containing protein